METEIESEKEELNEEKEVDDIFRDSQKWEREGEKNELEILKEGWKQMEMTRKMKIDESELRKKNEKKEKKKKQTGLTGRGKQR